MSEPYDNECHYVLLERRKKRNVQGHSQKEKCYLEVAYATARLAVGGVTKWRLKKEVVTFRIKKSFTSSRHRRDR